MTIGTLMKPKRRSAIKQVPDSGTLTPGAALTTFSIRTATDGELVPNGMEIRGVTVSHINPSTGAAVSTISELILYRSAGRLAKHIVYEDAWDSLPATERRLNNTYWDYHNEDKSNEIFGAVRIKSGANAAAIVIEISFE